MFLWALQRRLDVRESPGEVVDVASHQNLSPEVTSGCGGRMGMVLHCDFSICRFLYYFLTYFLTLSMYFFCLLSLCQWFTWAEKLWGFFCLFFGVFLRVFLSLSFVCLLSLCLSAYLSTYLPSSLLPVSVYPYISNMSIVSYLKPL